MPKFSESSKEKLSTVHCDLQILFNEVIKEYDCTIVFGYRSPEEQRALFEQGRTKPGSIVTYKDGYERKSKHNQEPSFAVDVVPYPIDWDNKDRIRVFAGFVLGTYQQLKKQGKIKSNIRWGGDWDSDTILKDQRFNDFPHFEIY